MTPSTLSQRITKGTAEIDKDTYIIIDKNTDVEFDVIGITANKCSIVLLPLDQVTQEEAEANAELITEAFNVTNQTGFTPKELAEQNEKLLYAAKLVKDYIDYPHTHKGTTRIRKAVENALKS